MDTTPYRNVDRPNTEQRTTVHFVRGEALDESPDLSYLEQDYAEASPEERAKALAADAERLRGFHRGAWHMCGFFVEARVWVPIGGNSFATYTLRSPGVWGTESDSSDEYKAELWAEEEKQLRAHLALMGAAFLDLEGATAG